MTVLDKVLTAKGIKNYDDLTPDEKVVFDRYKFILSGKNKVTIEMLEEFCRGQISLIEDRFASAEIKNDIYLKACLHVYLNLLKLVNAPKVERDGMERHLLSLINQND